MHSGGEMQYKVMSELLLYLELCICYNIIRYTKVTSIAPPVGEE